MPAQEGGTAKPRTMACQVFQNCNGLVRNQQPRCGLISVNMRDKHIRLFLFDVGRTGLFPRSRLLLGRLPGYPVAQGAPPNPTLDCGGDRRHSSDALGARGRAGDAPRQPRKRLAMKGRPMESNRPRVSWSWRSVIHSDGRRCITLWRSPSLERGDSPSAHR